MLSTIHERSVPEYLSKQRLLLIKHQNGQEKSLIGGYLTQEGLNPETPIYVVMVGDELYIRDNVGNHSTNTSKVNTRKLSSVLNGKERDGVLITGVIRTKADGDWEGHMNVLLDASYGKNAMIVRGYNKTNMFSN